jgi:hypothetical protein
MWPARGYVVKSSAPAVLLAAIQSSTSPVRTVESHRQNVARKLRELQPPVSPTPLGLARWLQHWGLHEEAT